MAPASELPVELFRDETPEEEVQVVTTSRLPSEEMRGADSPVSSSSSCVFIVSRTMSCLMLGGCRMDLSEMVELLDVGISGTSTSTSSG